MEASLELEIKHLSLSGDKKRGRKMGLILAIYTDDAYQEVHLPAIDNADYDLWLRARAYGIKQDIHVFMDVLDRQWRFKSAKEYMVLQSDCRVEETVLYPGQVLQIETLKGDSLTVLILASLEKLVEYQKYTILGGPISIGKDESCDIYYKTQPIMSRHHAQLQFRHGTCIIKDTSTNGTYVGNQRIRNSQELCFGDAINLYGLSIIFLGNILCVRCIEGEVNVNSKKLEVFTENQENARDTGSRVVSDKKQIVHISPRIIPKLYDGEEKIDNVPQKREDDKKPAWMSILPSFTMMLPMMLGYTLMSAGNASMGIFITGGSAIVGTSWSIVNLRYAKKEYREKEQRRLQRYEEYLVQCADRIREKFEYNGHALLEMYPDAMTCSSYSGNSAEIWARSKGYSDFLFVRLGLGDIPFQVKITVPQQGFSMIDDELSDRPEKLAKNFETLHNMPVGVSLGEYSVVGVLTGNDNRAALNISQVMIAQLAATHSPADVKIVALFDKKNEEAQELSYVRWLPHVWNEEHNMRYVASDENEINDVLYSLAQILRNRAESRTTNYSSATKCYPHYVLFVENPEMLESQMITKYLYEYGKELGATTVIFSQLYEKLPSECSFIIQNDREFQGAYAVREGGDERRHITFDTIDTEKMNKMAKNMSSLKVNQIEASSDIPNSVTFFEMLGIHRLEELNVLEHWRKNRTYESMKVLIGKKAGNKDCYLDINEKYHGPHGLVAGTTGSGKSETLQTYILSMAVNFSPLDVGFLIIDFKGGGMANLFSRLPHTVGQISNLSGNQVRRAMVSIKSENRRRERIFGEYGVKNIDEYTKLVKNREASEPIPHLLIVIDEFAELKREEPEFMRELISVAQVGRSLGVHLILATQKPSGTVDDNIWSNTKFKLCLRVADKHDSNDMLHKPDAAYLTQTGRGYLQVGNDEIYEQFQSGWSGAVYDVDDGNKKSGAVLLDLQGREMVSGRRLKEEKKKHAMLKWITEIVSIIQKISVDLQGYTSVFLCTREERHLLAQYTIRQLNAKEERFPENASNIHTIEEMLQSWPENIDADAEIAEYLITQFQTEHKKLPEQKEITQLDAVVQYLCEVAEKNQYINHQKLWMPELPVQLAIKDLHGYEENVWKEGQWPQHIKEFRLSTYIGLVDDPENQMQYPLCIDLAEKGHLSVVGGVTSGKSTLLQTLVYGLISGYSPEEVNIYAVDFSSQMLCPFENDAHVGGIVLEGEDERLNKLFGLIGSILAERKMMIKGGSFGQYIKLHGHVLPAVVLVIDGYANFREKTENRFEDILLELSRSAEGYGIYLVISSAGFGTSELQNKIADNMRQSICLELGDKYRYSEALRTSHFDVLPENNVKGRGLVLYEGNVLEYQTAISCVAENDYARSEMIRTECEQMSLSWIGRKAAPIPEIPQKPTWQIFTALEAYQKMVQEKNMLPIAYVQENASVFGVDLAKTCCYSIIGRERTGKSMLLRNIACAAKDMGGRILFFDQEKCLDKDIADVVGAEYASQPQEYFTGIKELITITNSRAPRRKELLKQGLEDDEVFEVMSREFPTVFVCIADLLAFMQTIYKNIEGIGMLNPWMENIFAKARLLNVYFFGVYNVTQISSMMDKIAYLNFVHEKNGILLGGEISKQSILSYTNVSYSDQTKRMKNGMGYATNPEDNQIVDLIVIPQNRGKL